MIQFKIWFHEFWSKKHGDMKFGSLNLNLMEKGFIEIPWPLGRKGPRSPACTGGPT
jgi:hypothetical protein